MELLAAGRFGNIDLTIVIVYLVGIMLVGIVAGYRKHASTEQFFLAGKDRHFYPAKVEAVEGGRFAASSEFVDEPVAVRYAWGVHPIGNFGNRAGPAAPFRTDNWPAWSDYPFRNVTEPAEPNASQSTGHLTAVPTPESAKSQAWERKKAQAHKVLDEYEAWKKTQKTKGQ